MTLPAKLRRMSRRRQKIALAKRIQDDLVKLVGQPNSPAVRAQVVRVVQERIGLVPYIDVLVKMRRPVDHITLNFTITKP